jgi:hypothetical protein
VLEPVPTTSFIHRYADDAQNPHLLRHHARRIPRRPNLCDQPLSRSSAVCRRRMPLLLQHSATDHRWAWCIGYDVTLGGAEVGRY